MKKNTAELNTKHKIPAQLNVLIFQKVFLYTFNN